MGSSLKNIYHLRMTYKNEKLIWLNMN